MPALGSGGEAGGAGAGTGPGVVSGPGSTTCWGRAGSASGRNALRLHFRRDALFGWLSPAGGTEVTVSLTGQSWHRHH